ncbi:MAG: hypothetical protein ACREGE_03230 [Candidatus Microsaccharimonas sp.]
MNELAGDLAGLRFEIMVGGYRPPFDNATKATRKELADYFGIEHGGRRELRRRLKLVEKHLPYSYALEAAFWVLALDEWPHRTTPEERLNLLLDSRGKKRWNADDPSDYNHLYQRVADGIYAICVAYDPVMKLEGLPSAGVQYVR